MADPLSIAASVVTLLTVCVKVSRELKHICNDAVVDTKVESLLHDVESFAEVIQLMAETLKEANVQSSLSATGHIGNHWKNLSRSIRDAQETLGKLQEIVERVNKNVTLLDGPRKRLRLKAAAEEVEVFREHLRSYRDTLQLSLQTIIL